MIRNRLIVTTILLLAGSVSSADPWADAIVEAHPALDGSGLYNDARSVLGPPASFFYDALMRRQREVSLVSPAIYLDAPDGQKLVTTIHTGQFVKVRFDEPVEDHARNPFGIDFMVYGNSFFVGTGFALPDTDMASFLLTGGIFAESVMVAVSPTGIGHPQTHPDEWYEYADGPFCDGLFPTNAFLWNRGVQDWGLPADSTLPTDPSLSASGFSRLSAADAIALYECSAGGTGFDLASSGFSVIQYVYLTSAGGEVDALADVFPSLGDFDRDGDVDLRDFGSFQNCLAESIGENRTCACRSGDIDGSGRVDLADVRPMVGYLQGRE